MVTWQLVWLAIVLSGGMIGWLVSRDRGGIIAGLALTFFVSGMFGGICMVGLWGGEGSLSSDSIASGQCVPYETVGVIASIERNTEASGSFILGTGSVHSTMYYFAYVDTTNGWYLEKYRRTKTYIVEGDAVPQVITTNYKCDKPIVSWLFDKQVYHNHYSRKHIIHVPPNTILREFKL